MLYTKQAEDVLAQVREHVEAGEMDEENGLAFQQMLVDCAARIICHPIVASNNYLRRFSQGVSFAQARHEMQQFSVFALQFDVAQAKLVANAPTREVYEERLNVLLNEKGIPYKDGFEGELTGQWRLATVHFSWLQKSAEGLGLSFEEIGKIWLGYQEQSNSCSRRLTTTRASSKNVAAGAAFAIENWAANFLWTPWIAGMKVLNQKLHQEGKPEIQLGYLTYHESEERHHSQATLDELLEDFSEPWFDSDKFFEGAERILTEGVQAYYESQLASLPEKDGSWPARACEPRAFDPASLPRLAGSAKAAV